MAFPYGVLLLDDFNRATLGPNWSQMGGWPNPADVAASTKFTGNASYGGSYYNASTFGPDCAGYVTVDNVVNEEFYIYFRLQSPSTTGIDGYMLRILTNAGTPHPWALFRITDNATTKIDVGSATQTIVDGCKLGFEASGASIKGHYYDGASWANIVSATDATYGAAGNVGIGLSTAVTHLDDLYVGTVASETRPYADVFITA
jgi:hypothetical protein